MTVLLIATLDTKGSEAGFLRDQIRATGASVIVMDVGCQGAPLFPAEITRAAVFEAAGTTHAAAVARADRGAAVTAAARGATALTVDLFKKGLIQGVIAAGGGAGTTIATQAMRELPPGFPKVMISTLASGEVAHFVGSGDIMMINSIVDISGLNRISRAVLTRAAQAVAAMALAGPLLTNSSDRPLIGASMFGVTTPCVERCRAILESKGYEVLVFHATGTGGRTLESLAASGMLAGVLDITTTELADEHVGGFLTAGPGRLTAAGRAGIPQIVSVGALDMVNFHGMASVPDQFKKRMLYKHNDNVTLMRTTPEECYHIGRRIGEKLANARGPRLLLFPAGGVSAIDRPGQPFDDPVARQELLRGIQETAGAAPVQVIDAHINDPQFAEAAASALLRMLA